MPFNFWYPMTQRAKAKARQPREVAPFFCTEQVNINGVWFRCGGTHARKAKRHATMIVDSSGRNVHLEWGK